MSILQSSTHADCCCAVYCRSHANLLLKAANPDFEADLYKVYDEDGQVYYVWADFRGVNDEIAYRPVFIGEEIPAIERFELIKAGEAFDHCDSYYVTVLNSANDLIIRQIKVISNEQMLRQLLADDKELRPIEAICLVKLYAIGKGKQFLTLAWSVVANQTIFYLPALDKDWRLFDEYSIGALLKEEAVSGIPLKMHDKYYTPLRNAKDGWYLDCSKELRLMPKMG